MTTTVIQVPSISCERCKATIETALSELDGVRDVSVDIALRSVSVDHDPARVDVARLREAIEDQGYDTA